MTVVELLRLVEGLADHRAGVVGLVRVADVQGDVLLAHGEDRPLVEHLRADVAQLAQLGIGDALDGLGILDDARVGHQEAGHVRPVLIDVRVERGRGQRAGDVAAAAGEGLDRAVGHDAVKAGHHDAAAGGRVLQRLIARLLIDGTVETELQPHSAVEEVEAQIVGHQLRREIFAARDELVLTDPLIHLPAQGGELALEVGPEPQLVADGEIAVADHLIDPVAADAVLQVRVAQIQQVRDLVIVLIALARGTHDDDAAALVRGDDGADFFKLCGVRHGRSAEFQNF